MFCPKCGSQVLTDAEFCFSCGKPVSAIQDQIGLRVTKPLVSNSAKKTIRLKRKPTLVWGSSIAVALVLSTVLLSPLLFAKRLSQEEAESLLLGDSHWSFGRGLKTGELELNGMNELVYPNYTCDVDDQIRNVIRFEGNVLAGGSYKEGNRGSVQNIIEFSSSTFPQESIELATEGYDSRDCFYNAENNVGFFSDNINFTSNTYGLGLDNSVKAIYFEINARAGEFSDDNSRANLLVADGIYLVQISINGYASEADGAAKQVALGVLEKIYRDRASLD